MFQASSKGQQAKVRNQTVSEHGERRCSHHPVPLGSAHMDPASSVLPRPKNLERWLENCTHAAPDDPDPKYAFCHVLNDYLVVLDSMKLNRAEAQGASGHPTPGSLQTWTDDLSGAETIFHIAILTALKTTQQAFLALCQLYAARETRNMLEELSEEVD
ncbi:MAG: hypothetical protein Q9184_005904 [Pyrenodesmia sp. 2 TL-2023]